MPEHGDPDKFRQLYDNDLSEIEKGFYELEEHDHAHLYKILKQNKKI